MATQAQGQSAWDVEWGLLPPNSRQLHFWGPCCLFCTCPLSVAFPVLIILWFASLFRCLSQGDADFVCYGPAAAVPVIVVACVLLLCCPYVRPRRLHCCGLSNTVCSRELLLYPPLVVELAWFLFCPNQLLGGGCRTASYWSCTSECCPADTGVPIEVVTHCPHPHNAVFPKGGRGIGGESTSARNSSELPHASAGSSRA